MLVIEKAAPDLAAVVREIIARDMAEALITTGADLTDDQAVADALFRAGFGSTSIAALIEDACHRALAA